MTRIEPPLGQIVIGTLHHATSDVYLPKAVETLKCMDNVTDIVIFMCIKYIFFWFYRSFRLKASIEYIKKIVRQLWNALMFRFLFRYMTNKNVFSLQVYIDRSDGH